MLANPLLAELLAGGLPWPRGALVGALAKHWVVSEPEMVPELAELARYVAGWAAWAVLAGAVVGLAAGAGQGAGQGRGWREAVRWAAASSAGSGLGWLVGMTVLLLSGEFPARSLLLLALLSSPNRVALLGWLGDDAALLVLAAAMGMVRATLTGALGGLAYALVTGAGLTRLLRERLAEEAVPPAAA